MTCNNQTQHIRTRKKKTKLNSQTYCYAFSKYTVAYQVDIPMQNLQLSEIKDKILRLTLRKLLGSIC